MTFDKDDWIKMCAIVLHKLAPGQQVVLDGAFIDKALAELGMPSVLVDTNERGDLLLQCISSAEARRIAYHRQQTGQFVQVVKHNGKRTQ